MNGILLVNKPKGMTSHDVVAFLRRRLKQKEIGHAGTLDPMAQGLLVCLLGEATKLSDFVLNEKKSYLARVRFGLRTDTLDIEGTVLEERDVNLEKEAVRAAVLKLTGSFQWPVPIYSAVKKEGRKLYEHARQNSPVSLPEREMHFLNVDFCGWEPPECTVELTCSKGSFVRTWADQLGRSLGVPACLSGLTRTKSEPFSLERSISLSEIETTAPETLDQSPSFLKLDNCLSHMSGVSLRGRELKLLVNGQVPHSLERRLVPEQRTVNESRAQTNIRVLDGETGQLMAVLQLNPMQALRIRRVFKRS